MLSKTHIQNRQQERVLKRLQEKSNKQVSHFIQRLKKIEKLIDKSWLKITTYEW